MFIMEIETVFILAARGLEMASKPTHTHSACKFVNVLLMLSGCNSKNSG